MQEAQGIARVQKLAWKMDDIGIVPTFETKAVSSFGTVLVAKTIDDEVIGFIYAMPMFDKLNGKPINCHYSHMMAIVPSYQNTGIGLELKKAHRNIALESEFNIQKISWTVDPLLPNNAYLNFAKLGVKCNKYYVNYYGDPSSDGVGIYAGVDTDRFFVDWFIREEKVASRLENYRTDRVNLTEMCNRSPPINNVVDEEPVYLQNFKDRPFTVEVPSNYHELRETKVEIAKKWRIYFRDICLDAFSKNFSTTDYHTILDNGVRRNFYEFTPNLQNY
jgi:predicted GNAT superfamily acetyltransferase